jgi:hypothetical protein
MMSNNPSMSRPYRASYFLEFLFPWKLSWVDMYRPFRALFHYGMGIGDKANVWCIGYGYRCWTRTIQPPHPYPIHYTLGKTIMSLDSRLQSAGITVFKNLFYLLFVTSVSEFTLSGVEGCLSG